MALKRIKLGRAVNLIKYLASVVSLTFLSNTLIWKKITFLLSHSVNLAELVVNELTKSISKKFTNIPFIFQFISRLCS